MYDAQIVKNYLITLRYIKYLLYAMESKVLLNIAECKRLRRRQGLSQEALAEACKQRRLHISIATIKRAEIGRLVSCRTAMALASFFGVSLDDVLLQKKPPAVIEQRDNPVLTILWLRFDKRDALAYILDLLQKNGSIWQELFGSGILATFGNSSEYGKAFLHVQMVLLNIRKVLHEFAETPIHFYAMLQLGAVQQNLDDTELTPKILQWFAQYSFIVPIDNIVVSSELYNLSEMHFSYRPLRQAETPVWLLENIKSYEPSSSLFGRDAELQQVNTILDHVGQHSNLDIVHIDGAAGIGKSRLLATILEQAYIRDILIVDIDLESVWHDPVQQLIPVLCQCLFAQIRSNLSEKQINNLLFNNKYTLDQQSIFAELLTNTTPTMGVYGTGYVSIDEPGQRQFNRITNEVALLKAMASIINCFVNQQGRVLLFAIDNFHLAGETGHCSLRQLLTYCKGLPLVCIITSRAEANISKVLGQFCDEGFSLATISLHALSRQAMELICNTYTDLDQTYKNQCVHLSAGVPLFLIQLLTRKKPLCNDIPSSLQLLVEQKLLHLNDNDRCVIELLSVCDAPLPLSAIIILLKQQSYCPESLIQTQLIKFDAVCGIKLNHKVVQLIIYQGLSNENRCSYHRVLAEYIEHELGDKFSNSQVLSLARHNEKAEQYFKAAYFNQIIVIRMLQHNLYPEALSLLQKALKILKLADAKQQQKDDLEIDIQLTLSTVYKIKYGWASPLLLHLYHRVEFLCERFACDKRLSLVFFGFWSIELTTLNFHKAQVIAERSLMMSKKHQDKHGIMLANIALSNTLFWCGKFQMAESVANTALAYYQPEFLNISIQWLGQDPRVLAACFAALSSSLLGQVEKAEYYRSLMLSTARQLRHDFSLAIALQASAWLDFHLIRPVAVLSQAEELETLSNKLDFPFYRGMAALFIGWARHKLDEEPGAALCVKQGYHKWLASSDDKIAHSLYCCILGEILIDTHCEDDAQILLKQAIKFAIEHDELCYLPEMYRLLALSSESTKRDNLLQKALFYSRESPLFSKRINTVFISQ